MTTTKTKPSAHTHIRPLADCVLVRVMEEKEVKRGGIIIPDTAKEKPQEGEVMAVGLGKLNDDGVRTPPEVKRGDRILYARYSGSEVNVDDEQYLIVRESDILAIL